VLKSGCRTEARQLETADRLRRCLAVYSVLAWRILYATLRSRAMPEGAVYRPIGARGMASALLRHSYDRHAAGAPPAAGSPLDWLSGGLPGPPGRWRTRGDVLWRGFQHLTELAFMYRIMRPPPTKPQNVGKD
jgi:hypothetical protein